MTSTTYYSPSSSLSRHSSKYNFSTSSSSSSASSKLYSSSPSSSSSSSSSFSPSSLRTRSSYDLNSYRPSSYTSTYTSSYTPKSYTSHHTTGGHNSCLGSSSSSFLSSKYSSGYGTTPVTLTRFNHRRTSFDCNDSEPPSKIKIPACGLTNLGNTCYMNSVLQALYGSKQLRDFVSNGLERGGQLYSALSKLFKEITSNVRIGYVNPSSFRTTFIQYESKFRGYDQQDAQEFLRYLINGLHEELNKAKSRPKRPLIEPKSSQEAWSQYRDRIDDSKLQELFVGQFSSVIKCTVCGNESTCWDPFWDLSLAVPRHRSRVDIDECLDSFTEMETLDGYEKPFCSNCKKHCRSTKRLSIERSPQILIIHLKRFSNDGYKLSSEITVNKSITINSKPYELYACVCHHGFSSRSGHYTAYCIHDSKWFHFNDEKVREVSDPFESSSHKDAYVLFYRLGGGSGGSNEYTSRYSSRL